MEKKNALQTAAFLKNTEKVLAFLMFILTAFHLLILYFQYAFITLNDSAILIDRCLLLSIIAGEIIYAFIPYFCFGRSIAGLKKIFRIAFRPDELLLLLIVAWYFVSCFYMKLEQGTNFFSLNSYFLLDSLISVIVIYPLGTVFKKHPKYIEWLLHFIMVFATIFMTCILINLFQLNTLELPGGDSFMITEGKFKGRLSIACNANTTGAYGAMLFMISVFMLLTHSKWYMRILYVYAAMVNLLIMNYSNSRTSCYSIVIICAFLGFILCYHKLFMVLWKRLLVSAFCGLAVGFVIFESRVLSYRIFDLITHFSEIYGFSQNIHTKNAFNLTGRMDLYASFFPAMFQNFERFLFGVTPSGVEAQIHGVGLISDNVVINYMHNQYMQMGIAFGFPGLLFYTVWSFMIMKKCILHFNSVRGIALSSVILMLILGNMLESYLFACAYFNGSLFFLFSGMIATDDTGLKSFHEFIAKIRE